jgi:hypothetical protein
MQRRRSIRKIQQDMNNIKDQESINNSNISRRNIGRRFTNRAVVEPVIQNIPKVIPVHNHAPVERDNFDYSYVERIWDKETVYIIGGGPSLRDFNFHGLLGSKVIAINKAIYAYPAAEVLYWTDSRFYTWYKNDIDQLGCLKYTLKTGSQYTDDIQILRKGATHGLEEPTDTLAHGNNSGYAAINLAYHLGAKRIILLGFDMMNDGDDSHFHDGYPTRGTGDRVYRDKFLPGFKSLAASLKKKGVIVLNASPYSRLNDFTKISLEAALSFR